MSKSNDSVLEASSRRWGSSSWIVMWREEIPVAYSNSTVECFSSLSSSISFRWIVYPKVSALDWFPFYVPHPSLFSVWYFLLPLLLSIFRCGILDVFSPARINRKGNQVNHMYREWETRQLESWRTKIVQRICTCEGREMRREERQLGHLESLLHWSGCCFSLLFCSFTFSYNTDKRWTHTNPESTSHFPLFVIPSFCSSSLAWTRIVIVISLFSPFGVERERVPLMFLSIIRE